MPRSASGSRLAKPKIPKIRPIKLISLPPAGVAIIPIPMPQAPFPGHFSLPEVMVYNWLDKHATDMNIEWAPQVAIGEAGSRVDVVITSPIYIYGRVQGLYFHVGDPAQAALDEMTRDRLMANFGRQVIDLWEPDIYNALDETMRDFLNGIQRPRPDSMYQVRPQWSHV